MTHLLAFGTSLVHFGEYLALSISLIFGFTITYSMITPHDELRLIRESNITAAIAFIGALIGFVLPLASIVSHSDSLIDVTIWGAVAFLIQLGGFFIANRIIEQCPATLSNRIENNELSAGVFSAGISIILGLINAACMVP